jgi:hypothetical protein
MEDLMRTLPKLPRPLAPAERQVTGPTWPDEFIEHWAAVYLAPEINAALRGRRVRFETFLRAPREILAALRRPVRFTYCGLLPAQRDVQERLRFESALEAVAEAALERVAAEAHCANGRVVEKLRHHAHPRSRAFFLGRH